MHMQDAPPPSGAASEQNGQTANDAAPGPHADHGFHRHGMSNESAQEGAMTMQHAGLPWYWIVPAAAAMAVIALWSLFAGPATDPPSRSVNLAAVPVIGRVVRFLNATAYPLVSAKFVAVALYLAVIAAGLIGTPYPERNLATVAVWNLWWPLVVVSVFFLGSAWCGVCPWDTLSSWIIRRRLFRRAKPHPGLNLRVPASLRNVWFALILFVGLAWLELGVDVTGMPFATAMLALVMLALSLTFLFVFERKAFCQYACPVGRTLGFYSRLAPVALRPVDQPTCDRCRTLECFNGSDEIEPCPTHLTMGGLNQNTYCLSCGNCTLSCPFKNVSWRLRPMGTEARERARPKWDEAWFMVALLGITSFHGFTMMPFWNDWVTLVARKIGETGDHLLSFTLSMLGGFALPAVIYAVAISWVWLSAPRGTSYRQLFSGFAFAALPLAFAYHLAHNMSHLVRESADLASVVLNPLGAGLDPLSAAERHEQMLNPLLPEQAVFAAQAGLFVLGFWLAVRIARNRGTDMLGENGSATMGWLLPLLTFIGAITAINLWLTAQDMVMRF